jgi:hypothetical protein
VVATLISPGRLAYHRRRQHKLAHIRSDKTDKSAAGGKPSYFRPIPAYRPAMVPFAVTVSCFFPLGLGRPVFFMGKQSLSPHPSNTISSVHDFHRLKQGATLLSFNRIISLEREDGFACTCFRTPSL